MVSTSDPVPNNRLCYYFEVRILNPTEGVCRMDIGFTSRKISFKEMVVRAKNGRSGFKSIPDSFGYSSTGSIYDSYSNERSSKRQEYAGGDVIRCYIDKQKAICSFTKNEELLGKVLHIKDVTTPIFPSIAFYSNRTIIDCKFAQTDFEPDTEGTY